MDFPVWTLIPFVLMLLGIAVFPLVPKLEPLWERPRNQLIYALVLGVPVAIGLLLSFIGTIGAAMLLIRPILATNAERRYRAHTVVFTIFVVANSGGLLTPLGDPPLCLGMLRGVPFTWTFGLLPMWLFVNALL